MKAVLPVIAPLHDVQRDIRDDHARVSPHAARTAKDPRSLTE
jgi:hypothetical protein